MRIIDCSSDVCSSDLAPCPDCVDDRNAERGDIVAVAYPAGRPPCDVEAQLQPASADQPKQSFGLCVPRLWPARKPPMPLSRNPNAPGNLVPPTGAGPPLLPPSPPPPRTPLAPQGVRWGKRMAQ